MSRRPPNPGAEKAEQNRQNLKTLVKIESNKSCADCKRNKHPRWASWNLGIFVCIRCSGIHRGMGTHISRVKSVDLDAWTDEQLQNMVRWGNARANKYWEAKLALGHVPAEAKIENFIRTKYESKRWVMEGGIPDPSTLGTEDGIPPESGQEKARFERSSSLRAPPSSSQPPLAKAPPPVDLFGDETPTPPARAQTTEPSTTSPPVPPKNNAQPRQTKAADSLLGFDFFNSAPQSNPAKGSAAPATTRPDLKQSILSLYATPKPTPVPQQASSSPTGQQPLGGLGDDFSGLNFGAPAPQQQQQPRASAFAGLASPSKPTSGNRSGGGHFFDTKPNPPVTQSSGHQRGVSSSSGFGDFTSVSPTRTQPPTSNGSASLLDFSASPTRPTAQQVKPTPTDFTSPFNLSKPAPQRPVQHPVVSDPWGSNNVWASSEAPTAAKPPAPPLKSPATTAAVTNDWEWGGSTAAPSQPVQVRGDEDFGGWGSNPGPASPGASRKPAPKPMVNNDDLFSNVWE